MKISASISELPVTLDVTSYHPATPGSFNPRDGGSPPEGAEIEFRVLVGGPPYSDKQVDITDALSDELIEALTDEAIELMDDNDRGFEVEP